MFMLCATFKLQDTHVHEIVHVVTGCCLVMEYYYACSYVHEYEYKGNRKLNDNSRNVRPTEKRLRNKKCVSNT